MNGKIFFILGCLFGLLSVVLGAFGAHALKTRVTPEMLAIFETGVRYQMYHALVLLAVSWAVTHFAPAPASLAGWFFTAGILIFSGSLYLLVASGIRAWGAVTPIGGLLLIIGWANLLLSAFRAP